MRGLKDNEIQELTNKLRDELKAFATIESLREYISHTIIDYLESKNLRIDKKECKHDFQNAAGEDICTKCHKFEDE